MARRKTQAPSHLFLGKSDTRLLLDKCESYLLSGTLPDEKSDPGFIRELMWNYFNTVKEQRPNGREIAAMVHHYARQLGSIERSVKHVNERMVTGFSIEAIKQSYKRYRKSLTDEKKVSTLGFSETDDADWEGWISKHELLVERNTRISHQIEDWRQRALRSSVKKGQKR